MSDRVILSVDAMGGDFGPRITLPASLSALRRYPFLTIHLVGERSKLEKYLSKYRLPHSITSRLIIVHADDSVPMDEKPSTAIRSRQHSSMAIAVRLVADGVVDACVSAGNTGALMAFGRLVLKMQPGIDRPAIITPVPTQSGHCYMLDLGANVDCTAAHLLQFAIMGSVMAETVDGISRPTIGLLNVGEESIKGTELVRTADALIRQRTELNYIGYIEGSDVFSGKADVVVCDGFVGNIALKSCEGLTRLISQKVRHSFAKNMYRRFLAMLAQPVLREIQAQMDPSKRNGATMLGLQGIVMKSHGGANRKSFGYALDQAISEVRQNVPQQISAKLASLANPNPQ